MLLLAVASTCQAQYSVLHYFTGDTSDGFNPVDAPTAIGSTLYGVASGGGSNYDGALYAMNTDGSGYQLVYNFAGYFVDGSNPRAAPVAVGSTLYGMTSTGGLSGLGGTVFTINADGSGYQILRLFGFTGGPGPDGGLPYGSPTVSGTTLYGATLMGGTANYGTLFKMNTDGSAYQVFHTFTGGSFDGAYPYCTLTLSGSTLYGTTGGGGTGEDGSGGTLFKINADGTGFQLLHSFSGPEGETPLGSLTLSGSFLYGMTPYGGSNGVGTVFRIGLDGTGFELLHTFSAVDGATPTGSLTLSGSILYGITTYGGVSNNGALFQMNTDGTGYQVLHSFTGGPTDGYYAYGSLTLSSNTLYGTTEYGGINDNGTVFSYTLIPEPGTWALLTLGITLLLAIRRSRR